ncbi:hypothetical protein AYL99_11039 [Fonsecaea erecta]|uniref:Uncharacterized protein n=1 Tax=Fonsecaea erecta TaxID=1367422 RepID=A0A178Z4Z8_9EURO|nr:hypothetical protein AYL99_11039 [Fonsecaea erecta]OAP54591.1 hypothetical protein AYL99_11039 [Fonsecaea erecta]
MRDPNSLGSQPTADRVVPIVVGAAENLSNVLASDQGDTTTQLPGHPVSPFGQTEIMLSSVTNKLDSMTNKLDSTINKLDSMTNKLDSVNNKLDSMCNKLDSMCNKLDSTDKFNSLDNKLDALTARTMANAHNSMARLQNGHSHWHEEPLVPLVNPATNAAIPGFPPSYSDVTDNMDDQGLDAVLRELELSTEGNALEKKRRIRQFIGIKPLRGY